MEVGVTNNYPDVTAGYFLDAIHSVGRVPRILRADNGTENVHIAAFQRFFQREEVDAFAGEKSFMYEDQSLISGSRRGWINSAKVAWISRRHYFKDLRDNGLFCGHSIFDNRIYTILLYVYHTRGMKHGN